MNVLSVGRPFSLCQVSIVAFLLSILCGDFLLSSTRCCQLDGPFGLGQVSKSDDKRCRLMQLILRDCAWVIALGSVL